MEKTRWAIMVCLNEQDDDWIYVTETTEHCWDIRPVLFDDIQEAFDYSDAWRLPGKEQNVQVVAYNEDQTSK